ncbi:MAG: fatty acyl-AMP ligase [Limnospira sp. PMC 894.15]|uniref:Fatty acyl-AMP ligase n=1 Tax=Limnospira fusiformis PMC 851.14 TaxID=2219512 RepID=A0ABU9EMR4_LIMFS|nr:fatty acyl-AMP ligase [Limnospira sp. PMC 894.15]MDT9187519.1 fatty acyl-AMP ligase [Limnospira sp. PMC 894.15]
MTAFQHPFDAATLMEILKGRAIHQPHQVAYKFLVDGETETISLTYQKLDRICRAIAAHLQSLSQPGERALLLYQPGIDYITAFFGCLYAGIVPIPAYPPRPNRSLSRIMGILEDADSHLALTTESVLPSLQRQFGEVWELQKLNWVATDKVAESCSDRYEDLSINPESLAFLQYTSGSTATPKGAMISHQNLMHNSGWIYEKFGHNQDSIGMIWLPPYHDMGLIGGIIQPLYGGFPVVLMSPLMFLQRPIRWLEAISRHGATTSGGSNFAYDLCVRRVTPDQIETLDLSSWDLAFNGAEPISHEVLEKFARTFASCGFNPQAFYPCYGMAEATLIVSGGDKTQLPTLKTIQASSLEQHQAIATNGHAENTRTVVGCGSSLEDQAIAIVDPSTGIPCEPGQVGEIWVSGPSIAQGYWNRPSETESIFSQYLATTGEGPFLRTGDLGFIENGELFITGRLKDVIIINGRNHYPQDIEWTVEQSHPLIRPSCAAGFSVDVGGEERLVVIAEVERYYWKRQSSPRRETSTNVSREESFSTKDLIQSIRRAVSQNHDLQVYSTLLLKPGTIPKTSSGKIQRHACRAGFLAGTLEVVED